LDGQKRAATRRRKRELSGICGWFGEAGGDSRIVLDAMRRRFVWRESDPQATIVGTHFALAAAGPPGTTAAVESGPIAIVIQGHPLWCGGGDGARDDAGNLVAFCRRIVDAYLERGDEFLSGVCGDFALALIDARSGSAMLAIDRMGVRTLIYELSQGNLIFGATSDVVRAHPLATAAIDLQSIYDYVYFHMVPGPNTAFRGHERLLPGHGLTFANGRLATQPYWQITFSEPTRGRVEDFKSRFRAALNSSVADCVAAEPCGTFLSGGTDSSTLAGVLGAITGTPARTYSIGFAAAGYDEMEYARITARHFGTEHHEHYVTPDDVVRAIPLLAAAYDQPFGNASAVPTYYCARLAKEDGVRQLLGGDGGDELFGGNSRYAKQYQLALYERVPETLRQRILEPLLLSWPGIATIPMLRKVRSYVEQARLPMPARYESYNLLERLGPGSVFAAEFLAEIDQGLPRARLREAYDSTQASSLINRLLALDLRFTLADNDLLKVTRTCDLAGVDVAFPLLHESVVELSAVLPPDFKLRGTRLRYFFKEALRDFLPRATIMKKKHGFGLPAGLWLRDHHPLHELAADALASLRRRRIFRNEFLGELMTRQLRDHPGYYGTLVWVLMMLELWFEKQTSRSVSATRKV
jgi:asparagine synthase (glutamine-hydrolysing)